MGFDRSCAAASLLLLDHALDDLRLLDEECTDDAGNQIQIICIWNKDNVTHRERTQSPQREPPYARWTVLRVLLTVAYSRGRRATIYRFHLNTGLIVQIFCERTPGSLMPQSPHLGAVGSFLMWW